MKTITAMCTLCAAVSLVGTASAQPAKNRGSLSRTATAARQSTSFHNPYTSGRVSADLVLPGRGKPLASVVLITGSGRREAAASSALQTYLTGRGFAVMTLPPVPLTGATENDNLNAVAALHYLETRPELRGAPAGFVGYGDGVRLAVIAAARCGAGAFLALLGGAVAPDKLNTLPGTLSQTALPQDEAVRSLQNVRCPVLVLLGEYDRQGTHRTVAENVDVLRSALDQRRNKNSTVKVLNDADACLADTGPGGDNPSTTAIPPQSVWKTASDWIGKQAQKVDPAPSADTVDAPNGKEGIPVYPKSVYGEFRYHPWYSWAPTVGDQSRPFGYWYW